MWLYQYQYDLARGAECSKLHLFSRKSGRIAIAKIGPMLKMVSVKVRVVSKMSAIRMLRFPSLLLPYYLGSSWSSGERLSFAVFLP